MLLEQLCIIILISSASAEKSLESKIVQGLLAPITNHAHSVFITISERGGSFVCGASVLNQNILLTAAHCIDVCNILCWDATAYAGNANKKRGHMVPILKTLSHPNYNQYRIKNDIGLILLQNSLPLGKLIKRVAILKNPPKVRSAIIAGWGLINEVDTVYTDNLHYQKQTVWSSEECEQMISSLPKGTFCAGDEGNRRYASEGDSGSALMIDGYIEIGIVSFKRPEVSRGVVVYTDVGYFYDWIRENSRELFCEYNDKR